MLMSLCVCLSLSLYICTQTHTNSFYPSILHQQEFIQESAADALREFLFSYFSTGDEEPTERLQKLTTLTYTTGLDTDENVAATRGCALALGALPLKLLCRPEGRLDTVLSSLANSASEKRLIAGCADAETRRCE